MRSVFSALMAYVISHFWSHHSLRLENMALRHQLAIYQHSVKRPKLRPADRLLWVCLSRLWPSWQQAIEFVQPRTVIAWRKQRSWGSPRIVGELRKLGITVAKSTVEKYRPRLRKPPSPTWKAFLASHVPELVSCDFFIVPTVTCRILFVFIILAHERRRIVHFNITEHPTAQWAAQQIVDAFPCETAPRYLLRDRDAIYGELCQRRVQHMGIEEVKISPRSPWQNPYVERIMGSMRRDVLDHVIVLHERHLHRLLTKYSTYHRFRPHLSLEMDCPKPRAGHPPELGKVIEVREINGLYHPYERQQAA